MSIITIFSGTFCKEDAVIQKVLDHTGYRLITDKDLVAEASRISGMSEEKIMRAFSARASVFNKFTHEKERSIAHIRYALAQIMSGDNLIIAGFTGHLIPRKISHVLRICLIADMKSRISIATKENGFTEKEAVRQIHRQEEDRSAWVDTVTGSSDPWDPSLYDMIIPTDKIDIGGVPSLVMEHLEKDILKATDESQALVQDFLLGASVAVALAKEGHNVDVSAKHGSVTLSINKHVLMLNRLKDELKSIADKVPGVKAVETKAGKNYYKADIYRKFDFETPSKVLLVDDEREFVQTLSERLLLRDMGSAVAYDGESALRLVREDEPEVMILDLKMPGIDGIEVLRRVKETNPEIEVIILTGHGSEADRETCMKLGAFAYLHKPVNIDLLSETLKKANEKIREKKDLKIKGS
ncbi:MAG: response regulator [Desulfobacteraceae bacterium 4484_190.2]|nr:MAG: response regulator [Desulfobacteraceae bacterium 4484_190.2]